MVSIIRGGCQTAGNWLRGSAFEFSDTTRSTSHRAVTEEWLEDYNSERPHESLGEVPPREFLPRRESARESTFNLST